MGSTESGDLFRVNIRINDEEIYKIYKKRLIDVSGRINSTIDYNAYIKLIAEGEKPAIERLREKEEKEAK